VGPRQTLGLWVLAGDRVCVELAVRRNL